MNRCRPIIFGTAIALCGLVGYTAPAEASQPRVTPEVRRVTLGNGMKLWLEENNEQPILAYSLIIDAGPQYDPPGQSGLARATLRAVSLASGDRDETAQQRWLDSLGAELTHSVSHDGARLTAVFNSRELISSVRFFRDLFTAPRFDSVSMNNLLRRMVTSATQLRDVGLPYMPEVARQALYRGTSLASSIWGSAKSFSAMTTSDIRAFYDRYYTPERVTLVVSGDFDTKRLQYELSLAFNIIPGSSAERDTTTVAIAPSRDTTGKYRIYLIDQPGAVAAQIGVYAPLASAYDSSFAGEMSLAYILAGAGELSLIGQELITERALVSTIDAETPFSRHGSVAEIMLACPTDAVAETIERTLAWLGRARDTRLSKRDLEDTKRRFAGRFGLAFETALMTSERLADLAQAGMDYRAHDALLLAQEALTPDKMQGLAQRMFAPANVMVVVLGDAERYREALRAFGDVTVVTD